MKSLLLACALALIVLPAAAGGQVTRYELFDLVPPGSAAEYKTVAGFSSMLVVAVMQDSGELPLKRASGLTQKQLP
jgi:hypothetical protein